MKRKLVKTGSSLAITLPAEVVQEFKLKAGQQVEVSVHPQTGAVVIRPGVKYFAEGAVTRGLRERIHRLAERRQGPYEKLAK